MKRSEINGAIRWAKALLEKNNIHLPDAAHWSVDEWRAHAGDIDTIRRTMMGWDITDFGTGDFAATGAVLYTIRNGLVDEPGVGVPYCEKLIVMKEGQRLPKHYHVYKTEDIINRAGGVLAVYLWNANAAGEQLDSDVVCISKSLHRERLAQNADIFDFELDAEDMAAIATLDNGDKLLPEPDHIFVPRPDGKRPDPKIIK